MSNTGAPGRASSEWARKVVKPGAGVRCGEPRSAVGAPQPLDDTEQEALPGTEPTGPPPFASPEDASLLAETAPESAAVAEVENDSIR